VTGQIADQIATHTASDIVLSAFGRNARIFTGVMDNTDVFFNVARVALGDKDLNRQDYQHGNRQERSDEVD
jgi:alkaline phosphatase